MYVFWLLPRRVFFLPSTGGSILIDYIICVCIYIVYVLKVHRNVIRSWAIDFTRNCNTRGQLNLDKRTDRIVSELNEDGKKHCEVSLQR